jgi:hypothetical protein
VGSQSPCRPHTQSRRPQCVGSPKGLDYATPNDRAAAVSGGIGATTHQILACERHKGHHVSLCRRGGCGILRHVAGHELHRCHEPLAYEALQMLLCDLGRGIILFCYVSRGKKKQHSLSPKNLSFLSLSLSLSLGPCLVHMERYICPC